VTSNVGVDERHRTVLSVCPDRELARFRHDVLAEAGFQVVSVHTVSSALYEISFGRCGILLLCHRLNKASRETLASYFHEHCPEPYIVSILANEDDHYPPQTHARVVHSNDPATLVRALRENLAA
jgi:DNA-binding NtrC family response regulator